MMHDCQNTYVRDALPDFVHESLGDGDRRAVAEHLGACTDCADELELLREVLRAAPAPRVDVGRIVAAVPVYRRSPYFGRTYLQVAAALVVAAVGVTGVMLTRATRDEAQPEVLADAVVAVRASGGGTGVALVDVGGLNDASLARLTREMTTLEAAPPAEPAEPEVDLDFAASQGGV